MTQWARALAALLIAVASPQLASGETLNIARTVYPPCYIPPPPDTAGWSVIRMHTGGTWRFDLKLPASFTRRLQSIGFEGSTAYDDGRRRVINGDGMVCLPEPAPGCSECIDSIGGHRFVITSAYQDSKYHVAASPVVGDSLIVQKGGIRLSSPDSTDQRLLFSILRTICERARTSWKGALFFGGHEMHPPFRLTFVKNRLAVNGFWLPKYDPPWIRGVGSVESELRTLESQLVATRDSLLQAGLSWGEAQVHIRQTAQHNSHVQSAELEPRENNHQSTIRIRLKHGYEAILLARSGHPLHKGGAFEQNELFLDARLAYLGDLLDAGGTVFILGGTYEYVIDAAHTQGALDAVRDIAKGGHQHRDAPSLPDEVQEQIRDPLPLERAP